MYGALMSNRGRVMVDGKLARIMPRNSGRQLFFYTHGRKHGKLSQIYAPLASHVFGAFNPHLKTKSGRMPRTDFIDGNPNNCRLDNLRHKLPQTRQEIARKWNLKQEVALNGGEKIKMKVIENGRNWSTTESELFAMYEPTRDNVPEIKDRPEGRFNSYYGNKDPSYYFKGYAAGRIENVIADITLKNGARMEKMETRIKTLEIENALLRRYMSEREYRDLTGDTSI